MGLSSFFGHRPAHEIKPAPAKAGVPSGREAGHVAADFREDDARAQFVDPGNGGQELNGGAKGLDMSVDLVIDGVDRRVDGVDPLQMQAQQKAMMPGDASA